MRGDANYYTKQQGWFDYWDIYYLAASRFPNGNLLEVGVWKGLSLKYLAEKAPEAQIYGVDVFEYDQEYHGRTGSFLEDAQKRLEAFKNVQLIKKDSFEFAKDEEHLIYDFIFLDTFHDYEQIKKELHAYWPLLKKGGLFAGHDYGGSHVGVKQAVDEFAKEKGLEIKVSRYSWFTFKPM